MGELVVDKALCARAVEAYGDMVLRLAFQRLGSQADAEDAAQEVFLKLLREKRFQDEGHLKRWLVRVTLHRCADLRRSAWRRHIVPLEGTPWPAFSPEERETLEELWSLPPRTGTSSTSTITRATPSLRQPSSWGRRQTR